MSPSEAMTRRQWVRRPISNPSARDFDMPEQQDGYSSNVFTEKAEQLQRVVAYVEDKGFIPRELVQNEVSWFYG
jgi:hypothetical protein